MSIFFKRLGGFYKYRFLMQQLVTKDIKLKYRRSILGYLWSILISIPPPSAGGTNSNESVLTLYVVL